VQERGPHLFTVLGPAGIGKSRLAREFSMLVADEATTLVGRCLSYGEGITFWPLRELLLQVPSEEHHRVSFLLGGDRGEDGALVATTEEIFLSSRRLLESVSRERPLLVVLEDLHWADPTFLDLVEYVAQRATEAPMLLLCLARSELLELRDTWGGGLENTSSLRLEPLTEDETEQLLDALQASSGARAPVREVAEGNPLFVEQMLAWLEETGTAGRDRTLPPTIQAVLAARLDRLGPGEAAVLFRAAVIGRDFGSDAVLELLPADAKAPAPRHLDALVRKGLLRPLDADPDDGRQFRFAHALVQDAAYRMLPKRLRAELHERFADWLERTTGAGGQDEIVGYHLAQAHDYRAELEGESERTRALARSAAARLADAGRRSIEREDFPAAVELLERVLGLLPDDDRLRREVLPELGVALAAIGQVERAEGLLSLAIEGAVGEGDLLAETWARIVREGVRTFRTPGAFTTQRREAQQALRAFEQAGDERGLARAWGLLAWVEHASGKISASEVAYRRSIEHARRAGDAGEEVEGLRRLAQLALMGPTPVDEAVKRCEEILDRVKARPLAEGSALTAIGVLRAHQGRFVEARVMLERGKEVISEASEMAAAWASIRVGAVEMLAGDPVAAENALRPAYETLERFGNTTDLAYVAHGLAQAMCAQGRYKQAIELVSPGEKELLQRASGNIVRGKALAGLGRLEEAERLVRDAVAVLDRTEMVIQQARAHSSLAEIMRTGGRPAEAVEHAGEAVRLLEQKGAVVLARRARALLAELAPGAGLLASTCARWPQGSKRAATGSKRLKPASLNHEESSREPRGNQHE
jgi:tetratricopeptide (TPR) repeat protein